MFSFNYKIFALPLIIFVFSCFKTDKDNSYLLWQDNRPLTWDDFKGKPEKRFAAASTCYDILKSISKTSTGNTITIKAVFFYYKSWKKWPLEEVLWHEQKHFDIVELFARKLRKQISEIKYTSQQDLENKVDALYKVIDKEMDEYQDLYDEESEGSMNGEKQREWNKKVIDEIKALENYKSIMVTLN